MSNFRAIFLGFVVAAIVLLFSDARRGNTAVSVQNTGEVNYTIPAGATTSPMAIQANNTPVTYNIAVTGGTQRGVSSVVLCYTTASPPTLAWSGHCPSVLAAGGVAVGGSTTTLNSTTIVPLNAGADVFLRVSNALNKVEIFNTADTTVNVTLEWVH
jgi:hypothetical protein